MARILLIDDDDAVRDMLHQMLVQLGHIVIEGRNGKEGLELLPNANADLLITDIVMPEMEGLELLMELRKKQPPMKIIAISGGGRGNAAEYLRAAKFLGASHVLAKPFTNEALLSAINELLLVGGTEGR